MVMEDVASDSTAALPSITAFHNDLSGMRNHKQRSYLHQVQDGASSCTDDPEGSPVIVSYLI